VQVHEAIELPFGVVNGVVPGFGLLYKGSDLTWIRRGFGFFCLLVYIVYLNALVVKRRIRLVHRKCTIFPLRHSDNISGIVVHWLLKNVVCYEIEVCIYEEVAKM